jgi:hypothetical protein
MGAFATLVMVIVGGAVVIGVAGLVVGLLVAAVAMLVKVAPMLLIGYAAVKLIQRSERRRPALRASDGAWLDR